MQLSTCFSVSLTLAVSWWSTGELILWSSHYQINFWYWLPYSLQVLWLCLPPLFLHWDLKWWPFLLTTAVSLLPVRGTSLLWEWTWRWTGLAYSGPDLFTATRTILGSVRWWARLYCLSLQEVCDAWHPMSWWTQQVSRGFSALSCVGVDLLWS